ncbi:helix-turn-helix domain-containing protein [Halomonas tibetensis]|uniref:Helix-turn-helix domain-containing protein n=1 Tax=Halomonas tibetensis TaxID=2259590 RepID=A0ABV7B6H9_9GAMM
MSHVRASDVATMADLSRSQLYSRLVPYGGFKTLLCEWRLERIARQLCAPENDATSIKTLLFSNGFSSTEQFQRLFRQRFGISATEFRQREKAAATHWCAD